MGALAPDTKWTPADDLMLKNAVEDGATLESLSKGAVRFSQRYTVQELQDRWHSILYDPIVSEEASDLMFEYERSLKTQETSNKIDGIKDTNSLLGKRKAESIRTLYYAMRKRISNVFHEGEPLDINFLAAGPCLTNYGNRTEHRFADYIFPDSCHQRCSDSTFALTTHARPDLFGGALPSSANHMTSAHSILVDRGLSVDPGDLGQKNMLPLEGISTPILPPVDCGSKEDYINDNIRSSHDVDNANALPSSVVHPIVNLNEERPSLGPEIETAGIITQLNQYCTNPGDLPETVDEFDIDTLNTLLVDYSDEHEGATEGYPGLAVSMSADFPEPRNGVICCKLNTEDHVIPDNDDVFLPVCMPTPSLSCLADFEFDKVHNPVSASIMDIPTHQMASRGGLLMMKRDQSDKDNNHLSSHRTNSSFLTHQKVRNEGAIMMKREQIDNEMSRIMSSSVPSPQNHNHRAMLLLQREETENNQPHISSHIMGSLLQPVIGSNHAVSVQDGNHNLKRIDPQSDMLRNEIANKQINQLKCTNENKNNSGGVNIKEKVISENEAEHQNDHPIGASLEGEVIGHNHICGSSSVVDASKPKNENLSVLHKEVFSHEELDTSKVIANESEKDLELLGNEECPDDDDVPYYSDVEAMILDMDFSPNDEDNDLSETVSRHPDEKLIKKMLRLEQAALASSHRMMQAYGAFAVLYSHHSRHLIKKPEVLLGRTAVDYEVDIDLSKERCRNKVSRRQAIIKVSGDGTFFLKNLGKVPMYVNGREVAPRQSRALTSSCLIEIRKAAFLFETNPARVKQYIEEENLRSKMKQEPVALE